MINFIICDDKKSDLNMAVSLIDKFMIKNEYEYEKHVFSDYDDDFLTIISRKMPGKIYILDIETPTRSGIDIARIIRTRDDDSILIFLTGHEEFGKVILESDFAYLSFINKFNDYEKRLENSLKKAIKIVGTKQTMRFTDNGCTYRVSFDDILYITRDNFDRKCIIKTDFNEFKVRIPLAELKNKLPEQFVQTHRAGIINKDRVMKYDKPKRLITFDNGEEIYLVSKRFKGSVI